MTKDIWREDATTLSDRLERGDLTPTALLELFLERIAQINPKINAFSYIDYDGARAAAVAATDRQHKGERRSALDGLPIAIKDNLFVAGMPACWGSIAFRGFVPDQDDICVERLRRAGAIIIGKTNTPEFALSGHTESVLFGVTRNPWNTALTPGGSSGGSSAAVAAGLVPFALGTDAGGSIRTPAAYTGLVGLRPVNGRIPRRFGFPAMALDFQSIGVLARTTRDTEMLMAVLSGSDPRDPTSMAVKPQAFPHGGALRIGWFDQVDGVTCDREVAAALDATVVRLAELGHGVEATPPPFDPAPLRACWSVLSGAGVARVATGIDGWKNALSEPIIRMAETGMKQTAAEYVEALDKLNLFRANTSVNWGDFDVLVMPTTPAAAWPVGQDAPSTIGGRPGTPDVQGMFCGWVNAMGYGAISVPAGRCADGRPIGIQIVARAPDDGCLTTIAAQLEKISAWSADWPSVATCN